MRKYFFLFIIILSCTHCIAQKDATIREYNKAITTYPFSNPNPDPNPVSLIYPYSRYDGFTNKPVKKEWKVVELDNDFIKVIILPQVGGKIWTAIDKKNNKPFIYDNNAIKFRDIAMRGPWTSGGLEANFGIVGHTPGVGQPYPDMINNKLEDDIQKLINQTKEGQKLSAEVFNNYKAKVKAITNRKAS